MSAFHLPRIAAPASAAEWDDLDLALASSRSTNSLAPVIEFAALQLGLGLGIDSAKAGAEADRDVEAVDEEAKQQLPPSASSELHLPVLTPRSQYVVLAASLHRALLTGGSPESPCALSKMSDARWRETSAAIHEINQRRERHDNEHALFDSANRAATTALPAHTQSSRPTPPVKAGERVEAAAVIAGSGSKSLSRSHLVPQSPPSSSDSSRFPALSSKLTAASQVRALLEYYRGNPVARAALEERVTELKRTTLRHVTARLQNNRARAANPDAAFDAQHETRRREEERRQAQLRRKADLEDRHNATLATMAKHQHALASRPNTTAAITTAGSAALAVASADDRQQRKRLQCEWLAWLAAINAQTRITALAKSTLLPALVERQSVALDARVTDLLHSALIAHLLTSRDAALAVLKARLTGATARWQFKRRRTAAVELVRFLTLVKSKDAIKRALNDTSVLTQIIAIQRCWRRKLAVLHAQRALAMNKWKKREQVINRQAQHAQQTHAQAQVVNAHTSSRPASASRAGRPPMASTAVLVDSAISRRIPATVKQQCVSDLVAARRAQHRAALRAHWLAVAQYEREHSSEMELRRTRSEMGIDESSQLQPVIPPPRFKFVPDNMEIDAAVEECAKQFLLAASDQLTVGHAISRPGSASRAAR